MKKRENLPKPKHWLYLLGPAFVWAATAQGSGELIWWPYLVARYGKAFLFLLLPAAIIQFFVNREVSRYTAITGKGIWKGFVDMNKWFSLALFGLCFINFLWFGGYATAGGSSLYEVLKWPGWGEKWGSLFWGYVMVGVFFLAILYSKVIYNLIEVIMKVITTITIVGLVASAIIVGTNKNIAEFAVALVNPSNLGVGVEWSGFDYSKLITGLVFAGMGGFLNLMYSYWMKDKGTGMAKYSPKMSGALSGKNEEDNGEVELLIKDDEINKTRWKAWVRYLNMDSFLAVFINVMTIVLTSFLAFVLLWPTRNYPEGWSITVSQSRFFEASFGAAGRVVFLLVAAAFLVDTWLALADGVSRQFADFCYSYWGKRGRLSSEKKWYTFWLIFLTVASIVTMPLANPGALMNITGVISVFAFVFYIPALWYLNYVKLPKLEPAFTKPTTVSSIWLWLVWMVYLGLAVWYLGVTIL